MAQRSDIPDMRFINRRLPIVAVARALNLLVDGAGKIHCWHPDRHQHGDRTASVGIRTSNNTVKCFGCSVGPIGPIDLVMDVLALQNAADAGLWIAERFPVPTIPARKRLTSESRLRSPVGYERGLGLLIRSGLWRILSEPAKAIAPVLMEYAEKRKAGVVFDVQIAYRRISRFSGIQSPNAIRKGLMELSEVGFLVLPGGPVHRSPDRQSGAYVVTPNSDQLWELAQMVARQQQQEIAAEIELRKRDRNARLKSKRTQPENQRPDALSTKYKNLYSRNSVKRKDAIREIA
jgi:hypothetical protein